jgi:hypothetical protein
MDRSRLFDRRGPVPGAAPLVFLHVPKAAGSSFMLHVAAHFRADEIGPPYWGDPATLQSARGKRFVAGHILFRDAIGAFEDAFLATFLREPVARVQSQYRSFHDPAKLSEPWRQRMTAEELANLEFAQRASFEEFVLSDRHNILAVLDNVQTAYLADADATGQAAVDSAIRNLRTRVGFFGLQERFEASLDLFRFQTGSRRRFTLPAASQNLSVAADLGLSAKGRRRLAEHVALDIPVYDAARRLFSRRLTELLIRRPFGALFR